ncbi:DUF1801 domain-containing protein [Catenulispora subtropica]|uniref:DUF1801 domain-containing protein n=1 Tax=Catenulispora subtropica TaxID=450798 RepID=A0ABN2TEP9_9ACTN
MTAPTEEWTAEERAAMKERAKEVKSAKRASKSSSTGSAVDPEAEVLAKIAEFDDADRALAEVIHTIVRTNAPHLTPRLWYGQPAYAKNGKVLCFFQPAAKFKTRYATLGFSDVAALDDGTMWPASYALTKLDSATEQRIAGLVKQAAA